jgi:hypothetical protein
VKEAVTVEALGLLAVKGRAAAEPAYSLSGLIQNHLLSANRRSHQ